jgi:hypothetical protein
VGGPRVVSWSRRERAAPSAPSAGHAFLGSRGCSEGPRAPDSSRERLVADSARLGGSSLARGAGAAALSRRRNRATAAPRQSGAPRTRPEIPDRHHYRPPRRKGRGVGDGERSSRALRTTCSSGGVPSRAPCRPRPPAGHAHSDSGSRHREEPVRRPRWRGARKRGAERVADRGDHGPPPIGERRVGERHDLESPRPRPRLRGRAPELSWCLLGRVSPPSRAPGEPLAS